MKFKCITKWTATDGSTFERTHIHESETFGEAYAAEQAHNATRFRSAEDQADGWKWAIVSIRPMLDTQVGGEIDKGDE